MTTETEHPVVLRMAGMFPADLGGYEDHRHRKGGDLGHVDKEKSSLNRRLLGDADWAAQARAELEDMKADNFAAELAKLRMRRRTAELQKRIVEGPRDPWRGTRHGPLREIILTANKAWFEAPGENAAPDETSLGPKPIDEIFGDGDESRQSRETRFEALALAWLKEHFGDDVIHARADLDEEVYHIHAVVLPRATTKDGRRMLQPSKHPMIKDYEAAQDSVGEWFRDLGLVRGEKRAKAIRDAVRANANHRGAAPRVVLPERREHVSPRDWRRAQERKLDARERKVGARETEADAVLDLATKVADGEIEVPEEDAETPPVQRPDGAGEQPEHDTATNAPPEAARALFGKALAKLRSQAREEARADLRKAWDQIKTADAAIDAAARLLPETARKKIAAARHSIAAAIASLPRHIRPDPRDQNGRE